MLRIIKFLRRSADLRSMKDKRFETRLLCADFVEVEWLTSDCGKRQVTALLEDISPAGICLQLEAELPLEVVTVSLNGRRTPAEVLYCQWREIGYFAGLIFPPNSRWSVKQYVPQHLTNPFELAEIAESRRMMKAADCLR